MQCDAICDYDFECAFECDRECAMQCNAMPYVNVELIKCEDDMQYAMQSVVMSRSINNNNTETTTMKSDRKEMSLILLEQLVCICWVSIGVC